MSIKSDNDIKPLYLQFQNADIWQKNLFVLNQVFFPARICLGPVNEESVKRRYIIAPIYSMGETLVYTSYSTYWYLLIVVCSCNI